MLMPSHRKARKSSTPRPKKVQDVSDRSSEASKVEAPQNGKSVSREDRNPPGPQAAPAAAPYRQERDTLREKLARVCEELEDENVRYRFQLSELGALYDLSERGDRDAKKVLCLLAREAQRIVDWRGLDLPPISQCKLKDTPELKGRTYDGADRIRYYNLIVVAIDALFDAAKDGSDEAEDFLRTKAEEFLQKTGTLRAPVEQPDSAAIVS
jgi:hypothetical protein